MKDDNIKKKYLETAINIGNRLVDSAIWDGDKCTWIVNEPDRERAAERVSKKEKAGINIYQGTTGISIFLSFLYKYYPNEKIKKAAEGGLNFALSGINIVSDFAFGFHSGRPGIAYACAKFAQYCNEEQFFIEAKNVLQPLYGNESKDAGIDVIGGAGGSIPILLILSEILNENSLVEMCEKLADNLIENARIESYGWGWGDKSPTHVKCLCGYAHGAAGIGQAFLELYSFTGKTKYLYAADKAFRYERNFYSEDKNNWPDFRHTDIGEYYFVNNFEELKLKATNNEIESYSPKFMNAWCHGAPGIALSRLRAYQLTDSVIYKKEALDACEETINSVKIPGGNYSLCHGKSGNAEPFILATRLLNDKKYIEVAEKVLSEGIEVFENTEYDWPCGTMQGVNDPGLMLGESGIGYFLLRLYDPELDSVLLPVVNRKYENLIEDYEEYQKNTFDKFFGNTLRIIQEKQIVPELDYKVKFDINSHENELVILNNKLKKIVNSKTEEFGYLKDVYILEEQKMNLFNNINDLTDEFIENLIKVPLIKDFDTALEFSLSKKNKIISLNVDPDIYMDSSSVTKPESEEKEYSVLLYQQGNKILHKKLSDFSAVILKMFKTPKSLNEVIESLKEIFEINTNDELEQLETVVRNQIVLAHSSNILVVIDNNNSLQKEEESNIHSCSKNCKHHN